MSFLFPSPEITLEAALRDVARGNPRSRAAAAHALGDVTEPTERSRAIAALLLALEDDRPEVRAAACASLGALAAADAVPALVKRLGDGVAAVRQGAAIALGTLRAADAFTPLLDALRGGPPDLRFQAVTSLAEIDPPRAFEAALRALEDADAQVAGAAALAVGAIARIDGARASEARAALAGKLTHPDAGVRFDVAYALAELHDDAGRATLAGALHDAERAWDAVTALAALGASEELSRAVASKQVPAEARVLAAGRLLALGGGAAEPARTGFAEGSADAARAVLVEAVASRRGHLRGLAVEQLAEVGGPWASAPLDRLARSGRAPELGEAIGQALEAIARRTS